MARAALVLAVLVPSSALAAACGQAPPPAVTVVSQPMQPQYRHVLTRSQISALRSGRGHMTSDRSHLGLTHTQTGVSVKPTVAFYRQPNGTTCAALHQVEVVWQMVQFQVDIAAEYRPGSCPYGEITRHENQHVVIAQRNFAATERALRRDFTEQARRFPAFPLRTGQQQATNEVAAHLLALARQIVDREERQMHGENAAIDTPESYRQVNARCRDW